VGAISKGPFAKSDPPSDDLEDFIPYAIELASTLKNTILVDQIPYQHQRREDLMQLLDEHITENIVKVGPKWVDPFNFLTAPPP
jgi:telomerase reverse transcriptase